MRASYPKLLLIVIVSMMVLGLVAGFVADRADRSRSNMQILGMVPQFSFAAADGGEFTLADLHGKITIVAFGFTRCKSICPVTSGHLASLYRLYSHSDKVQIIWMTVDPEYDTPEILRAYGERLGVNDSRWRFLYAPGDSVVWFSEDVFMLAADHLPGGHSPNFVLLDSSARIRSYHNGLEPVAIEVLKQNIRQLAKEMR